MERLKVNIDTSKLYGKDRKYKAIEIKNALEKIVNSLMFREMILKMDRDTWLKGSDKISRLKSNLDIYHDIMSGAEHNTPDKDGVIDIHIRNYYSRWGAIGYIIPFKPTIHVNTKYFDNMSIAKCASNALHEYMHTKNYFHVNGPNLRNSIPYYINKVVEDCYQILINKNKPTTEYYKTVCERKWYYLFLKKKCYQVRVN